MDKAGELARSPIWTRRAEAPLNHLLSEMRSFVPRKALIIMAAINRPEILDPALSRAGRRDRNILVGRPALRGRKAIFKVHPRKVNLPPDVDLEVLTARTP